MKNSGYALILLIATLLFDVIPGYHGSSSEDAVIGILYTLAILLFFLILTVEEK